MSIDSSVHASVQHGKDAALVQAAKDKRSSSNGTLVAQANDRIRRSQGKLLVTLILLDRARKTGR